jgi:hypothetical protein
MPENRDVWQKTFYHRAIQTSLGSALRAQYDLSEPMPDRLTQLLRELDDLDHELPERDDGGNDAAERGIGANRRPPDRS